VKLPAAWEVLHLAPARDDEIFACRGPRIPAVLAHLCVLSASGDSSSPHGRAERQSDDVIRQHAADWCRCGPYDLRWSSLLTVPSMKEGEGGFAYDMRPSPGHRDQKHKEISRLCPWRGLAITHTDGARGPGTCWRVRSHLHSERPAVHAIRKVESKPSQ
jgi:hypothetical protein